MSSKETVAVVKLDATSKITAIQCAMFKRETFPIMEELEVVGWFVKAAFAPFVFVGVLTFCHRDEDKVF